ncbi:MAG: 2-oxoacid:ferredoxin oxidoreductase subunit alpha [Arcobacter butzleri]|jgi:pyruvate ferredoxin oxidoreductase alpha subunit|nr:2-oxoacid:ferredoxin oxidoreductase subunit alpha [Arcobacteraceae bacterium]MDY0365101.1 2-oxoacid:ferredoxin oxidoreductase subunit alpha [Arcobacteraceae bacterium]NLO17337.1 2-oxoacid:ferredoxin oxidoreductase subunit alpha [Aliarcobacter butzleri]
MNKKIMELDSIEVWDGNMAAAQALRQADVDVVAAYPITPSTPTVENYAGFHANGYVDGEFVMVESEHAAMSACVGAAAAGGRVATATSSQGFALMIEVLYQASGMRTPITLMQVNRALAAPLNVNGDHSDMYLGRDSGWINTCAFSPQEVYDLTLCSFKIGEHLDVRLPVIVNQDGFMCSHTAQNVMTLDDKTANDFVGEYKVVNSMLDFSKPVTFGVQTEENWHFEHKAKQHDALMNSAKVIDEIFAEFEKLTGRKYNRVESYKMDDAEVAIVALGTTYESAQLAADEMRKEGIKAGVVAPRVIRPFPLEEIASALQNVKAIACMDRSAPGGTVGMLYNEICGALFNTSARPVVSNIIYGLGGRDMTINELCNIYKELDKDAKSGKRNGALQRFVGVRGPALNYYNI